MFSERNRPLGGSVIVTLLKLNEIHVFYVVLPIGRQKGELQSHPVLALEFLSRNL